MEDNPQAIVKRLTAEGPDKMTEEQIANALTAAGVSITQPTIHRIKHGASTSFEIGCALLRLAQGRSKPGERGKIALSA